MKKTAAVVLAVVACSFGLGMPLSVQADVPVLLSYQGYLSDSVGNPVTGEWTITFSFFHEATGGEPFYEETVDVETQLGLFTATLGAQSGNAIDYTEFYSGAVFLELTIETDVGPVVLSPRQQVVSNPFSFFSQTAVDAQGLGGKPPSAFVTVEGAAEVCVTPETLEAQLQALGFSPGSGYSDEDVAAYLAANGFNPCACYGDDDVAAYLLQAGYVPGPPFSGKYEDLSGTPDLGLYVLKDELIELVWASGAVLAADGSIPVTGALDFAGFQALNLAVHNAAEPPANPAEGQLWWDTKEKALKIYTGTQWSHVGGGTVSDLVCDGCVDHSDVSFPYAAAEVKSGAAIQSLDVKCEGCISATEVDFPWAKGVAPGGDALHSLTAKTAADVNCVGCVKAAEIDPAALTAANVTFNDSVAKLGAASVQKAIEKIAAASPVGFNEGNGTVIPYVEQWDLPAYGEARTYVHLMNPATPKVVMHLYAGEATGFASSSNLVVAYDFAPNQYSAGANGVKGETALQVQNSSIFSNGSHVLIHQTMGGEGTTAGAWEINQVTSVNGSTLQLLKPLQNTYKTQGTAKAQVVLAGSFGQIEIVNGGVVRPAIPLAADGSVGGIVYIRANKVTVKPGGVIKADGAGFAGGTMGVPAHHGSSECAIDPSAESGDNNCSGGGGQDSVCAASGGGGNKSAGQGGQTAQNCPGEGKGGSAKGDAQLATLQFGSGGGGTAFGAGGKGGGIIVIGAHSFVVQEGGKVSARGLDAPTAGGGGGAGGTIAVFAEEYIVDGDVSAPGGKGGPGSVWKYVNPSSEGIVSFDTHSHGGGFSPKYQEFWYPQWSGSTIFRFDRQFKPVGQFNSGTGDIMQLWGDLDGTYYTANWGQYKVRKFSDKGSQQIWEYHLGSTAGAVCSEGGFVYAMRNSGSTVWKLNAATGQNVETFSLPNCPGSIDGGLLCAPGRLYYASDGTTVRFYDINTHQQIGEFSTATNVYNMSFDGQYMYISSNSSTVYRYKLTDANIYMPSTAGGDGGEGWVVNKKPVQGIVNESYPKGVEIWLDGKNVTAEVGDPNGKGAPAWDAQGKVWGADGLSAWSTGPLDFTATVPWTLGEHEIRLKETGGAGGDIKMFLYVIYPFTKSTPPVNDTCDSPIMLNLAKPITVSGTTEDVMGKTKATDANQGPFCGGSGGPDVVYGFVLDDWRQLTIDTQCAFTPTIYIKATDCEKGDVVACGGAHLTTSSLSPGTYFLFVDGNGNLQKGDFVLKVTASLPGPPENDSCDSPTPLVFQNGVAEASGMTLFSNDFHQAVCGGAGAPENVYSFIVPPNVSLLTIVVEADFAPTIYLTKDVCTSSPIACIPSTSYQMGWPGPGTYYLFIDGKDETAKGLYKLKVTLK